MGGPWVFIRNVGLYQALHSGGSIMSPDRAPVQALMSLRESNEAAFFGLLAQDVTGLLPLVYTPTVGKACQKWSRLMPRPTGLYITSNDQVLSFLPLALQSTAAL